MAAPADEQATQHGAVRPTTADTSWRDGRAAARARDRRLPAGRPARWLTVSIRCQFTQRRRPGRLDSINAILDQLLRLNQRKSRADTRAASER